MIKVQQTVSQKKQQQTDCEIWFFHNKKRHRFLISVGLIFFLGLNVSPFFPFFFAFFEATKKKKNSNNQRPAVGGQQTAGSGYHRRPMAKRWKKEKSRETEKKKKKKKEEGEELKEEGKKVLDARGSPNGVSSYECSRGVLVVSAVMLLVRGVPSSSTVKSREAGQQQHKKKPKKEEKLSDILPLLGFTGFSSRCLLGFLACNGF